MTYLHPSAARIPVRTRGRRSPLNPLLHAARLAISLAAGPHLFGCQATAPKASNDLEALTAGIANVKTSIDVQSNYGIGAIVTTTTALIVVSIALIVVSLIAKRLIGYIIRDRELDRRNGTCHPKPPETALG